MDKSRTTHPLRQAARRVLALFLAVSAGWLAWITGDPGAALEALKELAADAGTATALLTAELGPMPEKQTLSYWDRVVLDQSPLLAMPLPGDGAGSGAGAGGGGGTGSGFGVGQAGGPGAGPTAVPTLPPVPTPVPVAAGEPQQDTEPLPSDEGEEGEPPLTTTAPDDIISRTFVPGTGSQYITKGQISVYNHTKYKVNLEDLLASAPHFAGGMEGPQVLIYHSHATEAYTMDGTDIYKESDSYRTLDPEFNMVRIGEEMKEVFEAAGLEVVHDTTLYDYPSYNASYSNSLEGITKWLKEYPSLVLLLDVHRDALAASDGRIYKTAAGTVENCAQVMMVIGSDAGGAVHPNWRQNLSLALEIQDVLTQTWPSLARPVVLRTSRFNQHLSTGTLLVEIGTHGNTLQEAITAARLYAEAAAAVLNGTQPSSSAPAP